MPGSAAASAVAQPVLAEVEGGDQGAVDDEVGVAADRRGEMGIAVEVEAEVAVVLGRVLRLRLRAENHLRDLLDLPRLAAPWRGCG